MADGSNPHDAVFRKMLGQPANAASQLRAILPAGVLARLDLDRLTQVSASFVDAELRRRHSDLVFTAPLAGREAFIYVLVEHQSKADPLMAFRMLRYVVRIWEHYLDDYPEARRLPGVIPVVVYHDQRAWHHPTDVWDLLDLDEQTAEQMREFMPRLRFLLDDLVVLDEPALRMRPLTPPVRLTLLLLKIAKGNHRLAYHLRPWAGELAAVLHQPGGRNDLKTLLRYIELVGETPPAELHKLFTQLGPPAEEVYVTTAEMLRAEGRREGRTEGEARGELRGRAESLVRLLSLRFGPLPPSTLTLVRGASVNQLEAWTDRVLTAGTLDEVLH